MRTLTVTLPDDMVADIEEMIAAGAYGSESEVVKDGLNALLDRDHDLDAEQTAQIRASYDRMKADPSLGIPIDEIQDRVRNGCWKVADADLPGHAFSRRRR